MSIATLSAALDRSVTDDPWHGSSLRKLLADVSADEASSHPIAGGHSVAEVVMHVAAWMDQVASWLEDHGRNMNDDLDWPRPSAWPQPMSTLLTAHERFLHTLGAFPETKLQEMIGAERDPTNGTGLSFEATIIGVAEHNAYHGGQIALLKRAARSRA